MILSKNKLNVHLIGAHGVGMSAICRFLLSKDFCVSGSDITVLDGSNDLVQSGLKYYLPSNVEIIENADVIVYSSAVPSTDLQLAMARKLNKPCYSRAEVLGKILRSKTSIGVAGSHGKTTTTAMIDFILKLNEIPVFSFVGVGGDFSVSKSAKIFLSEVCEYDRNISNITVDYPLVLNVDNDHLDTYKSIDNLEREFKSYLLRGKTPFVCSDDFRLKNVKNAVTFGLNHGAKYRAINLKSHGGKYSFSLLINGDIISDFSLSVYGKHNVINALASISICKEIFNLDYAEIKRALNLFTGVSRRFENGGKLFDKAIIFDYAHHPTEIEKTLSAVKEVFGSDYLVVFEPHTYSRTKLLFNDFIKVLSGENAIIYKTYPAREEYDYGGSHTLLAKTLNATEINDFKSLINEISKTKKSNVIILGAGELFEKFKKIKADK